MPNIILTGDKALDRNLHQLEAKLQRKVFNRAGREAVKPIAAKARQNAPKDTGRLRKSIKVRATKRSRRGVGIKVTTGDRSGDFGGKGYYGAFLEYGHKRGKRSRGVKNARALSEKKLVHNHGWFLRRRQRAQVRAAKALANDKRAAVPGLHFMKRAAEAGRAQAAATFQRVAREEIAAAVASMPKRD